MKYHFWAEVTESGTGIKMSEVAPSIGVTRSPIKLKIVEMKSGYKPFIPGQFLTIKAKTGRIIVFVTRDMEEAYAYAASTSLIVTEIRPDTRS